ncbi:EAL domain-containing protein [Pseudomonas sp. 5P_3.1_Bac2]|uniref:bifunctional diguanylate cyclase/phosphodiesterase n=1 Tax=Pseudomonas sp. 5P_3.1_Bac2 TaxID=2971617 RepID=UPI0021C8D265|nr:EAL domain-containing protein [Pseudomonas sp. 5P_3.1_Bac2]MCU1718542.1 EAL domain-containing protein [Pseudomonas sp. 5P_3.1_Bac2]
MLLALPRLSRWTWVLPLPLLLLASALSLFTWFSEGAGLWYLPYALALVMLLWWGPRVLLAVYLNGVLCAPLWELSWSWAPLFALPQTLSLGLAWWLLRNNFDPALPSTAALLRFVLRALLVASVPMCLGLALCLRLSGNLEATHLWRAAALLWLVDNLTALAVSVPLLVYLTPCLRRRQWLAASRLEGARHVDASLRQVPPWYVQLALLLGVGWLFGWVPLSVYLPLLGMQMLALALVWGFAGSVCGVLAGVILVLLLPVLRGVTEPLQSVDSSQLELYFSVLLFILASLLVGRSLSDMRQTLARSKQMQQQLALANQALEASPLGVTIADARQAQWPLIYCNPAFERITGYSRAELLGKSWDFLLSDDQGMESIIRLQQALEMGSRCEVVLRKQRKNGEHFSSHFTLAPLYDAQGVSHFFTLQSDVTVKEQLAEQVRAQSSELLKQSHLFSQTEHIADLGGWILKMPERSMDWSPGCYRIYELDPANGPPNLDVALGYMDAPSGALAAQTLQRVIQGQDQFEFEARLLSAKGKLRWLRIRGIAERDGSELVRIYGAIQDVSAHKDAEQQLRERDERLRLFFEAPLMGMALTDPNFVWEEVNQRLCSMLGRTAQQMQSCSWQSLSLAEELQLEQPLIDQLHSGQREGIELEKRWQRADGSILHSRVSLRAVRHSTGRVRMFLLLVEDTSERQQAEARYRAIVEHAPEAILLMDLSGRVVDCNENALRLLRYSREELYAKCVYELNPAMQPGGQASPELGQTYLEQVMAGGAPVFEWLHRDSRGCLVPCEVRLVRMPGEPVLIRGSVTDISERKQYQQEIERLAFSDELTGLPNRRLLLDRLQHSMNRELRAGTLGALLFIDLDHFKTVNDSLGHRAGDALLKEVTKRLSNNLRAEDTLARMGGDEFVVLLESLSDNPQIAARAATTTAEKLLQSLQGSCWIEDHELTISASIGIALHPFGSQSASDVLKQADTAMYRAKQSGRNALHFFAEQMQSEIDQRLQLQNELRQAIARQQLYLVFQPQLCLLSQQVRGAEVLLRWRHPQRGEIMPGDFIPLAEETGLIEEIGRWVLEQACRTLAQWLEQWPQLVLAVNLSPRELRRPGCVERISECLQRYQIPPTALEMEITEGVLMQDIEQCISNMQALKALGVRFAIDDFGTGYSSLTYLKRLPLDRLKIDRSFTWDMESEEGSALLLVQTILMIASNLGLDCVAEGIETVGQLQRLQASGCQLGQGYYFSRPLAEADFVAWLQQREA